MQILISSKKEKFNFSVISEQENIQYSVTYEIENIFTMFLIFPASEASTFGTGIDAACPTFLPSYKFIGYCRFCYCWKSSVHTKVRHQ